MTTHLETRIRKLERTNRLLTVGLLAAAAFFAAGSASETRDSEPLRAQRIELIDPDGTVRAMLGADAEGSTGLFVYDSEGGVRLSLTHDPDQSALFISDAEGTVRIGVAQFAHGGGGVALHGAQSKGATVLYHKDSGSLSLYDTEGERTLRIPAEKQ